MTADEEIRRLVLGACNGTRRTAADDEARRAVLRACGVETEESGGDAGEESRA